MTHKHLLKLKNVINNRSILLIVILIVCSCSKWKYNTKSEFEHPNYTTCEAVRFIHISTGKSRYWSCHYLYSVNGNRYYADGFGSEDSKYRIVGQHYKIKYDSLHPENALVLIEEPIFLPEDKVIKTIGFVNYLGKNFVEFRYKNELGTEYKNFQEMYKDYKIKHPNLVKGGTYEVEYAVNNPYNAIIYLDRPVKVE